MHVEMYVQVGAMCVTALETDGPRGVNVVLAIKCWERLYWYLCGCRLDLSSILQGRLPARTTGNSEAEANKLSCMVRGHYFYILLSIGVTIMFRWL